MNNSKGAELPEVSVIMAVFNRDFSLIKRALNSVMKQEFQHFEIIVVDDGSRVEIGEKILKYAADFESKITYIRHSNIGQAGSVNKAVSVSKAHFIGLIDSDDEYKPDHLSQCLKHIRKGYELIASVTETKVTKPQDFYVPDKNNINKDVHIDDCIVFGTLFGRRGVFSKIKFKNMYSLDSDFFERAGKLYRTKKLNLKTYLYYSGSEDGITTKQKRLRNIC